MNLRAHFCIFIEKKLLGWDLNPRPLAFKAVTKASQLLVQVMHLHGTHTGAAVCYDINEDKVRTVSYQWLPATIGNGGKHRTHDCCSDRCVYQAGQCVIPARE